MELMFESKSADFLREVIFDTISQEETAETIVPDSYPDVEQVLDAFASTVLRGKDYRNGSVSISGGIHAGVIYNPEDQSAPRALHFYIPFTVKLEHEAITEATRICVDCRVRSVDARIMNSRKVMIRVNLCGTVAGYEPASQEVFSYAPEADSDLQVRKSTYQVVRPMETAEKPFTMAEEAELPSGRSPMQELYAYQTDLEVIESKLVGNKGVFKGNINLRLLYLSEEEELVTWSCQLPFSQYVELEREYQDEELQTSIALTDINVEDANGQGKRLLVNLQMLAQCTVIGQDSMEIIEDAYSLYHDFAPQWKTVEAAGRLDRQTMTQVVRSVVQTPVKSIIDTQLYLDTPAVRREGDQVQITVPMTANVLYLDEAGQVQGTTARLEGTCQTELSENCTCRPAARLAGEAFAVPTGDGMEIRCTVEFTVDSISTQGIDTLCGGQLSDERQETAGRPSVILRNAESGDTIWALAKRCRTTAEAICMANGFSDEMAQPSGMLLIPILK